MAFEHAVVQNVEDKLGDADIPALERLKNAQLALEAVDKEITGLIASLGEWQHKHDAKQLVLDSVKEQIRKLDPHSGEDEMHDTLAEIADIVGVENPFIEDVTDEINSLEDAYGQLDDAVYALENCKSIVDNLLGDFQSYVEGYDPSIEVDDLRSRLENLFYDYKECFDAAERLA